jgi:hypothetical protein
MPATSLFLIQLGVSCRCLDYPCTKTKTKTHQLALYTAARWREQWSDRYCATAAQSCNTATRRIGGDPSATPVRAAVETYRNDSGCTPSPLLRYARKSITTEFLESARFLTPTFLSATRCALMWLINHIRNTAYIKSYLKSNHFHNTAYINSYFKSSDN